MFFFNFRQNNYNQFVPIKNVTVDRDTSHFKKRTRWKPAFWKNEIIQRLKYIDLTRKKKLNDHIMCSWTLERLVKMGFRFWLIEVYQQKKKTRYHWLPMSPYTWPQWSYTSFICVLVAGENGNFFFFFHRTKCKKISINPGSDILQSLHFLQ